jgi:hypothetical protein
MGNGIIEQTDHSKFLGIILDEHLTFSEHTSFICKKLSKSIGVLYKVRNILPTDALKILYHTLIHPFLQYGIEVWYGTDKNKTNKVFTLQKKAIRAIAHLDYNEHTNDSFKNMGILKLSNLYQFSLGNFMFKTIRTNSDPNLHETISAQFCPHDHVTRNCNKLVLPYYSRAKSHHCILFAGTKFWNSIPPYIRQNTSYKLFKADLEAYLLSQY